MDGLASSRKHGYIQRFDSVCTALGFPGQFAVLLGQFVNLLRNGTPVKMSKRKGTGIPFDELLGEVSVDATRYTLMSKSSNQMIDFDIEQVKRQDSSNPVYYVQYAHARICSILRRGAGVSIEEAQELGMDEVASRAATGRPVDTPPPPPASFLLDARGFPSMPVSMHVFMQRTACKLQLGSSCGAKRRHGAMILDARSGCHGKRQALWDKANRKARSRECCFEQLPPLLSLLSQWSP